MTHLGPGGRGVRSLRHNSFKVASDNESHRYVAMTYKAANKTHRGMESKAMPKAPRMYETNQKLCPVKSFENYLSKKLNPYFKSPWKVL